MRRCRLVRRGQGEPCQVTGFQVDGIEKVTTYPSCLLVDAGANTGYDDDLSREIGDVLRVACSPTRTSCGRD